MQPIQNQYWKDIQCLYSKKFMDFRNPLSPKIQHFVQKNTPKLPLLVKIA
jgi:hypothetical protein